MISVVLHEPEVAGNVGAVARLMANFGLSRLVIVNPQCDVKSLEAEGRAKHARPILKSAVVTDEKCLHSFDTLVGTTGRVGTDFNIPRSPLTPKQAVELLVPLVKKNHSVGLLFGSEGKGLSNQMIERCDFVVTIPADQKFQTLNLSHAVGIVLYELFVATAEQHTTSHFRLAQKQEKDALVKVISGVVDDMKWSRTPWRKETQRKIWKRLIGKWFLTKREVFGLFGFFRRVKPK
ncbi:RNA methyltransferase [Candidatus Woesearchaeota archaeon]|nr:RNA methyltransferase [Candidatus Woesearchaeota archaeon]